MKDDGDAQMGELVGGLQVGGGIAIRGRVKPNAKSFNVDLLMGNSSSSDVALSLNPRMNAKVFGRNSFLSGFWGVEERKLDKFPFAPGFYFEMKIHCGVDAFTVSVNCARLLEYKYRVDLDRITHVRVFGDLKLLFVQHGKV
ncbi:galectin-8-like [Hippocampus zosterae]|uniref:galectin-8-like n=1 Tax=Hippocampus zosterae TaxID=109293 RepID=UPI00223E67D6|nr:galectin-8-like [Hippocampus zosterae]